MQSTVELGSGRERVPAILQLPDAKGPVGAVLLLHGFTARKEQMASSIGAALAERGIGSITPDLPLHGARGGGMERLSLENPLALVTNWRLALREAAAAIDFLSTHPSIDASRIGIVGYSLGAYLSVFVAANDERVKTIALVAGGDLPARTPFASLVRTLADPIRAVRALEGRPFFMMNGTRDRVILPAQAKLLFEAAAEPKEHRWYEGPHWPPNRVVDEVADWVAKHLSPQPRLRRAS